MVIALGRSAQALRDLLLANRLGTSLEVDSLLLALVVPLLLSSVLAGSVSAALVPRRTSTGVGSPADAALLRRVATRLGLILAGVSSGLIVLAPQIPLLLAGTSSPGQQALITSLVRILAPIVVLSGFAALGEAFVLTYHRPALASLSQVVTALPSAILLIASQEPPTVRSLAWAILAGHAGQCVIAIGSATAMGFGTLLRTRTPTGDVAPFFGQYGALVVASSVMATTLAVDQVMAAPLGVGSVAVLNFGGKVPMFLLSIAALALSTILLPQLSNRASDSKALENFLRLVERRLLGMGALVAALLAASSPAVVNFLYGGDAMSGASLARIAEVQVALSLQVPFYLVTVLYTRSLSVLQRNQVLVAVGLGSVAGTIALNLVLREPFGVTGIALATSLMYAGTHIAVRTLSLRTIRPDPGLKPNV
jgi:putative peptidoglycan lipid II flippase